MTIANQHMEKLYQAILALDTPEDCKNFFEDLCTFKEIEQMAERLAVAEFLMNGETYEEIIAKTDISSATLSRVSKCVKYGTGYRKVLEKMSEAK